MQCLPLEADYPAHVQRESSPTHARLDFVGPLTPRQREVQIELCRRDLICSQDRIGRGDGARHSMESGKIGSSRSPHVTSQTMHCRVVGSIHDPTGRNALHRRRSMPDSAKRRAFDSILHEWTRSYTTQHNAASARPSCRSGYFISLLSVAPCGFVCLLATSGRRGTKAPFRHVQIEVNERPIKESRDR
ncbi:hypothetical protein BJY00DRAFT_19962 [Aspergillus carlsbadensis]|nr:hypothetical protein BJY00DRAFT_19962 [Aspergillus carlsbadensis]